MNTAKFYGVGVGPGDPDLMTLRAVKIIENSEIIAIRNGNGESSLALSIVKSVIPDVEKKKFLKFDMSMTKDMNTITAESAIAAKKISDYLKSGSSVAMLTIGDPAIYSTYLYIAEAVSALGFNCEIISGISSFSAAAARLGIGLVKADETLHIIPASYSLDDIDNITGTKILMKSGKNYPLLKKELLSKNIDAMMVSDCGLASEQIFYHTKDFPESSGYYSLIIIK